jgi:hypothetical protein
VAVAGDGVPVESSSSGALLSFKPSDTSQWLRRAASTSGTGAGAVSCDTWLYACVDGEAGDGVSCGARLQREAVGAAQRATSMCCMRCGHTVGGFALAGAASPGDEGGEARKARKKRKKKPAAAADSGMESGALPVLPLCPPSRFP